MYRVTVLLSGTPVVGGGISQHYLDQGGGTAQQALDAVAGFWLDMAAAMSSAVTITTQPEVELVDTASGQVEGVTTVTPTQTTGQAAGDILPTATQGLIRWRTGAFVGGREVRGRTFLPGMLEANNIDGKPAGGTVGILNSAALSYVNDPDAIPVIYSRTHRVFREITGASMWSQWAQLRSRRD